MFDKLIVTEPERAGLKKRKSYFMVSSLIVGALFLTAVVFSIFAADYGLGNGNFELVEITMPPEMTQTVEPEPQRPRSEAQTTTDLPTRVVNMPRVDESTIVPNAISSAPNRYISRPIGDFRIGATDSVGPGISGRDTSGTMPATGISSSQLASVDTPDVEAPPAISKEPKSKPQISKGVLNGEAKSLPKPVYTAAARAVRAQGPVTVQVTIDESGRVISANAIKGHYLLREEAEKAARNARFSPTFLSEVPVKVTGVITYNFVL
jgi:TonB family protein